VEEAFKLLADGGDNRFATMSDVEATDAAGEIDVAVSVYIFERGVFGFGYIDRRSVGEAAGDGCVAALCERFGFGSRDWGS
jgi:hypothetical protein